VSEYYLVNFDTGNNLLLNKNINHLLAISGGLVESLLKKDGTRDVITKARDCHKKGTVCLAVSLGVL
jgi:hypothetical protein